MSLKRSNEFSAVEQAALQKLFAEVEHMPKDGKWRSYENFFIFRNKLYTIKTEYRFERDEVSLLGFEVKKNNLVIPNCLH